MADALITAEKAYAELDKKAVVPFNDISNHWAKDAINFMYQAGYMSGVSGTEFAPNDLLTRGMLVAILYRIEGKPNVSGTCDFTDVAAGKYYYYPVIWAHSVGIVAGTTQNTFSPESNITREQMVTILYRYAKYRGDDVSARADLSGYADASQISSWAKDAMAWANAVGLISGRTTTTLVPKGTATRAEVATVLMKYLSVE